MPEPLPEWFAADQVFSAEDGWYVGVTDGFRIGPFPQQLHAEQQSRDLTARLQACRGTTDMVRAIRQFVFDQVSEHGRQIHASPGSVPAPAPHDRQASAPPVRAGEAARVWFRTNRVYAVGGMWFFSTREGIDIGPYATREQAERDLSCLIDILRRSSDPDRNLAAVRRFKDGLKPDDVG